MTGTINITGTGGILEGDWNDANIDVKLENAPSGNMLRSIFKHSRDVSTA